MTIGHGGLFNLLQISRHDRASVTCRFRHDQTSSVSCQIPTRAGNSSLEITSSGKPVENRETAFALKTPRWHVIADAGVILSIALNSWLDLSLKRFS
jgi:hypothetical protein